MEEKKKKSTKLRTLGTVLITIVSVLLCLFIVFKVAGLKVISEKDYHKAEKIEKQYGKLYEIQNLIEKDYLWEKPDSDKMMEGIYKEILDSLGDKYSRYFTKEEFKILQDQMNNNFTGLGAVLSNVDEEIKVMDIIEDGPAMTAGVKKGDVILKVDGKKYKTSQEAAKAMIGKAGTSVKLTVKRDGKEKDINVVRGDVFKSTISHETIDKNTGYIRIHSFGDKTGEDFKSAIDSMESKGIKNVVIDLRGNSGGLFKEGIKVADELLPESLITYTKNNKGKKKKINSDSKHTSLKYVLLVDGNTASASEVVAGAIKDNAGGKIVGEKTYGKGVVQETAVFKDGTAACITIMEYFSPKGNRIHGKGIEPDYTVKNDDSGKDKQLEKALEILK